MGKLKNKIFPHIDKHLMLIVGILYTVTAVVVVSTAWIEDLLRYNLRATISIYVALRPWTAVLYGIVALVMTFLGIRYVQKSIGSKLKRILYYIVFGCVLGCAIFPYNKTWSATSTMLHDALSIGLVLSVTISFVVMLIMAQSRSQRVFSIMAICFAAFFIIAYLIIHFKFFGNTLFIWENVFIYLLLVEL